MEKVLITLIVVYGLVNLCKYLFAYLTFCITHSRMMERKMMEEGGNNE